MLLTYKIRHGRDFSRELAKAKKVALLGVKLNTLSSGKVKHIGLKSAISCQILRRYVRNKDLKEIKHVPLIIPGQAIKVIDNKIWLCSVKLTLPIFFNRNFIKISQVELHEEYAFINVCYKEPELIKATTTLGVDRNSVDFGLVASCLETGKVLKLGKCFNYIHNKYFRIRRGFQKRKLFTCAKKLKHREKDIVKNLNHKFTKDLVLYAKKINATIVLENLDGVRKRKKKSMESKNTLSSWGVYQQKEMIEYKAKKYGVRVVYVDPAYTSQRCSKCGHIARYNRNGNLFKCKNCKTVEDSGANAGFNIAQLHKFGIPRFSKERVLLKENTGISKGLQFETIGPKILEINQSICQQAFLY
jgi:putative transposase